MMRRVSILPVVSPWCLVGVLCTVVGHQQVRAEEPPPDPARTAQVRAAEAARIRIVERLSPAVVCIFPKGHRNGGGSGVLISPEGYGLTNYHVVASLGAARLGDGGLADGKLYPLEVLGIDPAGDVAMFKLSRPEMDTRDVGPASRWSLTDRKPVPQEAADKQPFPFVPLGDSAAMQPGDPAIAMGNPFLLAEDFTPTVTFGIVSGNHRYLAGQGRALIYTDCIEIATSINPGNSGGPLFNLNGELVGINGRIGIEERGRVNVGVGYAIGINQIKRFIPALRAGLVTKHATLGATVYDKRHREVIVDQILETSDAYRAGLRLADRVHALNGREIHSANALLNVIGSLPAEWPIELAIRRDGEDRTLRFRLESLPMPKSPRMPKDMKGAPKLGPLSGENEEANITEVRRRLEQARYTVLQIRNPALQSRDRKGAGTAPDKITLNINSITPFGWNMHFTRKLIRTGTVSKQDSVEARDALPSLDNAAKLDPAAVEVAARWTLFDPPVQPRRSDWKIIRSDDVNGRLAVVLEFATQDGRRLRYTLDDETGRLLRLAFDDAKTGKAVRYEYEDVRPVFPLRLPHKRTLYLGDERYAEDVVSRYELIKAPRGN